MSNILLFVVSMKYIYLNVMLIVKIKKKHYCNSNEILVKGIFSVKILLSLKICLTYG